MSRFINAEGASLLPLCRAVGLAAVAAELNLQMDTLEPETARAIERGAAALFLAGYGPRLTGSTAGARLNERDGQRGTRGAFTKAKRIRRSVHEKSCGCDSCELKADSLSCYRDRIACQLENRLRSRKTFLSPFETMSTY